MLILLLVFSFSPIFPIMAPFGVLWACSALIAWKYQLSYVWRPECESGGKVLGGAWVLAWVGGAELMCYLSVVAVNTSENSYTHKTLPSTHAREESNAYTQAVGSSFSPTNPPQISTMSSPSNPTCSPHTPAQLWTRVYWQLLTSVWTMALLMTCVIGVKEKIGPAVFTGVLLVVIPFAGWLINRACKRPLEVMSLMAAAELDVKEGARNGDAKARG